jgi:hypothetical protein
MLLMIILLIINLMRKRTSINKKLPFNVNVYLLLLLSSKEASLFEEEESLLNSEHSSSWVNSSFNNLLK